MTRQTFYRKLRKYASQFIWSSVDGSIRGYHKNLCFCPITAVYYAETKQYLKSLYFDIAAKNMTLEQDDAGTIAQSSDLYFSELEPYQRAARQAILNSLNLDE